MAQFPATLPSFTDLSANQTLAQNSHTARHNKVHAEVAALAGKVGVDNSTDANSLDYIARHLNTDTKNYVDGRDAVTLNDAHSYTDQTYNAIMLAVRDMFLPVGSLYFNADNSANPATLLGFGTWVAYAKGQVPVGFDTTQTEFNLGGKTGGEKTHTLTNAEMPQHSITISHHGDETGSVIRQFSGTGGTTSAISTPGSYKAPPGSTAGAGSYQSPTVTWGSNTPHNVLQPYVTVYIWKRTA